MITKGMTTEAVFNEVKKDDYYVLGRMEGLMKKNNKKLKSKAYKNNDILSVSRYTVPETSDTVVVLAIKDLKTFKGKEYATINLMYYIITPYDTFITPTIDCINNTVVRYVEYSKHSVDRMKQRLGKDFDTFFREDYIKKNSGIFNLIKYDYNGDDSEYVAHIGEAFVFVKRNENGLKHIVTTILSTDDLHSNQLLLKLYSKKGEEARLNDIDDLKIVLGEAFLKTLKKSGAIRLNA